MINTEYVIFKHTCSNIVNDKEDFELARKKYHGS